MIASGQLDPKHLWKGGTDHSNSPPNEAKDNTGSLDCTIHKGLHRLREEPGQDGGRKIYLCL